MKAGKAAKIALGCSICFLVLLSQVALRSQSPQGMANGKPDKGYIVDLPMVAHDVSQPLSQIAALAVNLIVPLRAPTVRRLLHPPLPHGPQAEFTATPEPAFFGINLFA